MRDFFMNILLALYNLVNIVFIIWLMRSFFENRKNKKMTQNLILIGITLISIVFNILYADIQFSFGLSLVIYYGITLLVFDGSILTKLAASIFFMIFSLFCELFAAAILSIIFGNVVIDVRENTLYMFLGGVVSRLILLIVIQVIIHSRDRNKWNVSIKSWLVTLTIPIISIFLAVMSIYEPIINNNFSVLQILFCLSLLYINIITFYMFDSIIVQMNELGQFQLRESVWILQQKQYKEKLETYEQVRKVRHDMVGHLITIRDYLSGNKYEKIAVYIDQLHDQISIGVSGTISGNSVIDAIINNKKASISQKNIEYNEDMTLLGELNIQDMDLAIILENVINNAIEACERTGETTKKIILTVKYKNHNLLIELKNTYDMNTIKERNGKFISSKKNISEYEHGIGLTNVKDIIDKYHGVFKIELQEYYFVTKAIIPDKKI